MSYSCCWARVKLSPPTLTAANSDACSSRCSAPNPNVVGGLAGVQRSAGARCDSFRLSGLRGAGPAGPWPSRFRNVEPLIVGGLLLTGVWGVLLAVAGVVPSGVERGDHRMKVTLGVDVACRADHQASLADERGEFFWSAARFRTRVGDLDRLWARVPADAEVTVVLEPTRNAWSPLASWFTRRGARVVMVPSTQAADLRAYYSKHTKSDRLDSRVLARLPLLHPDGLRPVSGAGPADPLRRAARRRSSLVARRTAVMNRLDALVELLGPAWYEALGSDYEKTSLAVLAQYPNPEQPLRLGRARLEAFLRRCSRGQWGRGEGRGTAGRGAGVDRAVGRWPGLRRAGRRHPRRGRPPPVPDRADRCPRDPDRRAGR